MNSCPHCGGMIIGDGHTSPERCENADEDDYSLKEPDAKVTYCRQGPICKGCNKEIDPNCCGCGTSKESHGSPMDEGHSFVPAGCDCLRAR